MDLLLDDSMLDSLLTDARPKEEFKWEMCTYTLHDEAGCAWQPFGGYQQTGDATPHSQLSVTMDRPPLTSTEAHTWLWHKNCVIPPLKVSCSSDGLPLENASCLLSAVRVDVSEHAAHDVVVAVRSGAVNEGRQSRRVPQHHTAKQGDHRVG